MIKIKNSMENRVLTILEIRECLNKHQYIFINQRNLKFIHFETSEVYIYLQVAYKNLLFGKFNYHKNEMHFY